MVCLFIYCITICICIGKKAIWYDDAKILFQQSIYLKASLEEGGEEGRGGHIYVVWFFMEGDNESACFCQSEITQLGKYSLQQIVVRD